MMQLLKTKTWLIAAFCLFTINCSLQQQVVTWKAEEKSGIEDRTPAQTSEINAETDNVQSNVEFPHNLVELPKALSISQLPKDVELSQKIAETIEKSQFRNARWGVFVSSLKDGRVLVAQDAQKLFNPASTQKLFTTAVALDRLGSEYRWRTSMYAAGDIGADGTLSGDLILKGRGAPDFDEKGLTSLVEQLQARGLRRVRGNIVGDSSYFHADSLGDGWVWSEAQWYFGAEPSALSFSDNTVLVQITPGTSFGETVGVKTLPEASFMRIQNTAKTVASGARDTSGVHRDLDANSVQIWGDVPSNKPFSIRTTMHEPELWAADRLKKLLQSKGITVEGDARAVNWKTATADVANMRELCFVQSETLAEIIKRTNKRSINLNAELLLRTVGRQSRETIERQNNKTALGDDALGVMSIKQWLAEKNVATGETEIHDGSGLSRLDFVSPEIMGRLLVHAARMREFNVFKDSLPTAGTDGTLGGRLVKFKDKVFAKTGTITYVNALAGYAQIADDEAVAFVILCNNETSRENSVSTVDAIASLIAGSANPIDSTLKERNTQTK